MNRAVIYCRVSTEEEKQINALEKQIDEARNAVISNGWLLVDEYVDEGKSGTMIKYRDEFIRLSDDIETNKYDIIVVKSQDRLMRSTKDWYIFVDKLVQAQKKLFFYLENKFYNTDDALLTGIRAILAEEYSRELSKKLNSAHRYRQKNKGNIILTNMTWGYDNINKQIVINEKEAAIVRKMFEMSADGYGTKVISKTLFNEGWTSRQGNPFSEASISKIIRNPLYKGTAVMNKIHYDFNTKKSTKNDISEWIYKENAVPPIVDEKLWEEANRKMDERQRKMKSCNGKERYYGINLGKYPLSTKIVCGECGSNYWIRNYYRAGNVLEKQWSCSFYIKHGRKTRGHCISSNQVVRTKTGCDNIHINFNDLNDKLLEICDTLQLDKYKTKKDVLDVLKTALADKAESEKNSLDKELIEIQKRKDALLDAYLDKIIDDDIFKKKEETLILQEKNLRTKLSLMEHNDTSDIEMKRRIQELDNEIDEIIDNDVALNFVCRYIKHIIVYRDKLHIEFDIFPNCDINIEKINYRNKKMTIQWEKGTKSRTEK